MPPGIRSLIVFSYGAAQVEGPVMALAQRLEVPDRVLPGAPRVMAAHSALNLFKTSTDVIHSAPDSPDFGENSPATRQP
jgi:hypothetical protein